MKFIHKKQLILALLFLIILIGIFSFLKIKIEQKNQSAETIAQTWQVEESKREEIRSLNKSVTTIDAEKSILESHFAKGSDVVPFLNTIESLAIQVGIEAEISSVDVSKDNFGLEVAIQTGGSFEAVYKFLTLLENSPYLLEFISFDITKNPPPDPTVKVKKVLKWEGIFKVKLLTFVS